MAAEISSSISLAYAAFLKWPAIHSTLSLVCISRSKHIRTHTRTHIFVALFLLCPHSHNFTCAHPFQSTGAQRCMCIGLQRLPCLTNTTTTPSNTCTSTFPLTLALAFEPLRAVAFVTSRHCFKKLFAERFNLYLRFTAHECLPYAVPDGRWQSFAVCLLNKIYNLIYLKNYFKK